MITRIVKCSECNTTDIKQQGPYFDRNHMPLGVWPLYFVGNPFEPQLAEHYFCDVYCANKWFTKQRSDARVDSLSKDGESDAT